MLDRPTYLLACLTDRPTASISSSSFFSLLLLLADLLSFLPLLPLLDRYSSPLDAGRVCCWPRERERERERERGAERERESGREREKPQLSFSSCCREGCWLSSSSCRRLAATSAAGWPRERERQRERETGRERERENRCCSSSSLLDENCCCFSSIFVPFSCSFLHLLDRSSCSLVSRFYFLHFLPFSLLLAEPAALSLHLAEFLCPFLHSLVNFKCSLLAQLKILASLEVKPPTSFIFFKFSMDDYGVLSCLARSMQLML